VKEMRELWRRLTTTRTARAMEEEILPHMRAQEAEVTRQRAEIERLRAENERQRAEIERLRAENRALLNSILGIAGVPPVLVVAPPELLPGSSASEPAAVGTPQVEPVDRASATPRRARPAAAGALQDRSVAALPLRRRSWQQIHRALEFAALQKREPHEDSLT
jgi:hypothetical protein